ncbi:hypothetical protein [Candidatus Pelagadaptatus aseana]|uniref:hypothetical protein n=1 Tax=Candidatus Pelagadaptatus aseana TaxID=3120508 RepID=UPI003C6EE37D
MDAGKAITGAAYSVYYYRSALLKALLFPFIVYIVFELAYGANVHPVANFIFGVLSILIHVNVAITTHRMLLLGPDSVPEWGINRWSKRETLFAFHMLFLILLLCLIVIPLAFIPTVGMTLGVLVFFWLACRFSLAFPGIAVNEAVSFKLSWKLTQRHQFPLAVVLIIFPLVLFIPHYVIMLFLLGEYFSLIFSMATTVLEVAALSMAYRHIKQEEYSSQIL